LNSITKFVSELVRAANEPEKLTPSEFARLLDRAVVTTVDLRERAGIPSSGTSRDALVELSAIAYAADEQSNHQRSGALLKAADMIRTLHIVIESGVAIGVKIVESGKGP